MQNYHVSKIACFGLELLIPDADHVKHVHALEPSRPFPFWTRIWPSALVLARHLHEHPELTEDRHVLELGAGIGLPAFIAARNASHVTVSDHQLDAVRWMAMNCNILGYDDIMSCGQINWRSEQIPVPDVLLLSDVGYDPADFPHLQKLIDRMLGAGVLILVAVPARMVSAAFVDMLGPYVSWKTNEHVSGTDVLLLALQGTLS